MVDPTTTTDAAQEPLVPMLDPDGNPGSIPRSQVQAAIKAGGKIAVRMTAPDGSTGVVPYDKVQDATAAGGKLPGYTPPQPGMWKGFVDMGIKNMEAIGHQLLHEGDGDQAAFADAAEKHKEEVYHSASSMFHDAIANGDVGKVLGSGWELRKLFEKGDGTNPNDALGNIADGVLRGAEQTYKQAGEHATRAVSAIQEATQRSAFGDAAGAQKALETFSREAPTAAGYGLATAVPAIGPAAAKVGEDYPTNPSYATGEAAALLSPSIAKAGIEVAPAALNAIKGSAIMDYLPKVATPDLAGAMDATREFVKGAVGKVAQAVGKGTTKVVGNVAEAAGKNVIVPAVVGVLKGTGSALFEMGKDELANVTGNLADLAQSGADITTDAVSKAIDQLGPKYDVLKDQAAGIASDIAERVKGAVDPAAIKADIEQVFFDHHELVNDLILRNAGRLAGLGKELMDKVVDQYHEFRNPSVSGGSFDADNAINTAIKEPAMPTAPSYKTNLARLAYTDPAFDDLQAALTKGQVRGGGFAGVEKVARRIPGVGPDVFLDNANVSLNGALEEGINKMANDPNTGFHLKEILNKAQQNTINSGKLNLKAIIKQLDIGLRDESNTGRVGFFKNIAGADDVERLGRLGKTVTVGADLGDDTGRATLLRNALQEADYHLSHTAPFGGPLSTLSAIGLGGLLGHQFGGGALGTLAGAAVGIGGDLLAKTLAKHYFLDPSLPGDGLLSRVLTSIPKDETATLETKASAISAKYANTTLQKSPVFQKLTPAQKAQVMRNAATVYAKVKDYMAKVAPAQSVRPTPAAAPPPKE